MTGAASDEVERSWHGSELGKLLKWDRLCFPKLFDHRACLRKSEKYFINYWCGTLDLGKTKATMTYIYIWFPVASNQYTGQIAKAQLCHYNPCDLGQAP